MTSLDTFIPNTADLRPPKTEGCQGAVVVTQAAPLSHATSHGVVVADHESNISRMEYRMPLEKMRAYSLYSLDCTVCHLCPQTDSSIHFCQAKGYSFILPSIFCTMCVNVQMSSALYVRKTIIVQSKHRHNYNKNQGKYSICLYKIMFSR